MKLKSILQTALFVITSLTLTACSNEDDVDEIFVGVGKTWKMSGGKFKNQVFSKERIQQLHANKESYYIVFGNSTFSGKLSSNSSFSGSWRTDGGNRKIKLLVTSTNNCDQTEMDTEIIQLLNSVTHYSGDANNVALQTSDYSTLNMSSVNM